jgi:predicted phosphodiesterase
MEKTKVKIGVISDTHLDDYDEKMRKSIEDHFRDADMILHAGDMVDLRS